METKFNFNSKICTSREQSERLLALGLKKETADMVLCEPFDYEKCKYKDGYVKIVLEEGEGFCTSDIPAWSLHMLLLLLLDNRCVAYDHISFSIDETDVFTKVINHIEWLIKEGYFNKEYLVWKEVTK